MGDTLPADDNLTDQHHDWASNFTGIDTRAANGDPADATSAPGGATTAADPPANDPAPAANDPAPPANDPAPPANDAAAGAQSGDPPASPSEAGGGGAQAEGSGQDQPKKIVVSLVTSYGQSVRYWVQDLGVDHDNEAPMGSGTVLIDGEEHGPDETMQLTCVETANGAAICYDRESNPFPPGSARLGWSHALIPDGGRFVIQETGQTSAAAPAPGAPASGDDGQGGSGGQGTGDGTSGTGGDPSAGTSGGANDAQAGSPATDAGSAASQADGTTGPAAVASDTNPPPDAVPAVTNSAANASLLHRDGDPPSPPPDDNGGQRTLDTLTRDGDGPAGPPSASTSDDKNLMGIPAASPGNAPGGGDPAAGGAPGGPPAGGGSAANPYAGTSLESAWQQGFDEGLARPDANHEPPAPLSDDAQKVWSEGVLAGQDAAKSKPSAPTPAPAQPAPPAAPIGPPAPSGSGTPPTSGGATTVNPYSGTGLESAWKQGFDDGSAEPDSSHPPPSPYGDDMARVYAEGVLAGQDAVRPKTDNDPNQSTARSADDKLSNAAGTKVQIENISASATIPAGTTLYSDSERTISTQEATTITLGVASWGINATFSPNIKLDQGATIIITAIHYSFSTKTAEVVYDANTVLDWWFDIGPKLRAAVASTFAEKLPDSMRGAGYDPYQDPDLAQELNKVVGSLMGSGGGGGGPSLPKTTSANLHADVKLVGELRQGPISIPAGSEIGLDIDLDGGIPDQLADAKVRSVRMSISGPDRGANVNTNILGTDFPMILVHGVTVRNGGAITMDYEVIDGTIAAVIKYILAQESVHEGKPIGNVDLDPRDSMFRTTIDARIHSDLEPLLRKAVIDNKGAIPDIDLAKALGL